MLSQNQKKIRTLTLCTSPAVSAALVAVGGVSLIGWATGSVALTSGVASLPSMKANAALGFLALGIAIYLLRPSAASNERKAAEAIGAFLCLLAIGTLAQYAFGADFGLDEWLVKDFRAKVGTSHPGRMAPELAAAFLLYGLAILTRDAKPSRRFWPQQLFLFLGACVGFYEVLTYYYEVRNADFQNTRMALHSALACVAACFGLLTLYPDRGIVAIMMRPSSGGVLARRFLPTCIAIPTLLWWIRLRGQAAGLYSFEMGVALFVTLNVAFLVLLIAKTATGLHEADVKRTRAEAALRLSEERSRLILKSAHDAFIEVDQDGKITDWNERAQVIFGWTHGEALGKTIRELLFNAEAYQHYEQQIEAVFHSREDAQISARLEFQAFHKSGNAFPAEMSIAVLRIDGKPVVTAFVQDITERKRAENNLKSTQALFNSIIENIPDMIFLKDAKELRFVLFNRAGEKLLGYQRADLIGKNDYDFFPKDQADFFTAKDRDIVENRKLLDIQEPIDTKHLGTRTLHTKKLPIVDEHGVPQYLLGISADITDAKQAEIRIAEQQQLLLYSAKMSALGEMSGGIAHEINNPLAIIYGKAEELREVAESGSLDVELVRQVAARIESTTMRISRIIKGLQAFARDTEAEPFRPSSIKSILEDTLSFCQEKFKTHGTNVSVDEVADTLLLECRPVQVSQVLLNLLNNAFDAVQDQREKWIRIEVADRENTVDLVVSDSGPGIPSALRDRVFVPFFSTKDVGKGTGLGLSISKGIVESHSGALRIEDDGPQMKFVISLPKHQAESQRVA